MKKFVGWFIVLLLIFLVAFVYWKYIFTYSDGYRAGLLQKFSRKGNIFKTYEGEMILSSVSSNANVALASEKFYFSVKSPDVAKKLDQVQGDRIVIHYTEKNGALPWVGETKYLVDSVKVANINEALPPGMR